MTRTTFLLLVVQSCGTAPGTPCTTSRDCGDEGLLCALPPDGAADSTDETARGVCTYPLGGVGDACTSSAECDTELLCSNELPARTRHRRGTCEARHHVGEACATDTHCLAALECKALICTAP